MVVSLVALTRRRATWTEHRVSHLNFWESFRYQHELFAIIGQRCRFSSSSIVVVVRGNPESNRGAEVSEYLILIYQDESDPSWRDPATGEKMMKDHMAFGEKHGASLRGGNALHHTNSATSLRHDKNGKVTVTDGAFAETKEALGGYYLIEAADLDEAIAIAKDVPAALGGVEVRPIMPT
jgi:hypothetical protein